MNLQTGNYLTQRELWPDSGRHIMAHFDAQTVVVYQAYNSRIGHFAATHGYFGGDFKPGRMTWVKPNFLWMMYRSGWGAKQDQEVTLAVTIKRTAFDFILANAVASSFTASASIDRDSWKRALSESSVRLQWDPDHGPTGTKEDRRAIQLGLRGDTAQSYSCEWIVRIEDISEFVSAQRENSLPDRWTDLVTPRERPYPVSDRSVRERLGMHVSGWPLPK